MDIEKLLYYAFASNDLIVNALATTPEGYPLINRVRSPYAKYPLLNFSYIGGGDVKFADYEPHIERYVMEIDLYGDVDFEVKQEVKRVLNDLGFFLSHRDVTKNLHTGIEHNIYHVRQVLTHEMFQKRLSDQRELYLEKYDTTDLPLPGGSYFDPETGQEYEIEEDYDPDLVLGRLSPDTIIEDVDPDLILGN